MWMQSTSLLVLGCGQSDAHPFLLYCFYFYCENCWLVVLTLVSLNPSELKKCTIPGVTGFNNYYCYLLYFQHFQIFISYNYFMKHQFQT
jgi:hypothetical protein